MGYGDYLTILESMKNGYNVVDPNIVWDDMSQNMLTQEQAKSLVANGTRIVEAGFWGLMDYGFIDMASMEQATSELYHYHSEPHNDLTGVEVIKQRAKDLREMYGDDVLIVDYLIDEIGGYNQTIAPDKATNPGDPNGYGLDGEFNSDVEKAHDVIRQKLYEWKLALKEADIKLMAVSKPFSDLFDSSDLAQRLGRRMAVRALMTQINIMTARSLTYSSPKRHSSKAGEYMVPPDLALMPAGLYLI